MTKGCCRELVLLGTTIALEISENMLQEDISKLAGLFTVIGDQLALLAICAPETSENIAAETALV